VLLGCLFGLLVRLLRIMIVVTSLVVMLCVFAEVVVGSCCCWWVCVLIWLCPGLLSGCVAGVFVWVDTCG